MAFLKPVYDDGLEEIDTAVEAIKDGFDFYGRGAFVDAGEQFIAAGHSNDAAIHKFREVLSLVEDPAIDYAINARNRLLECKELRELAKDMESACDAMLSDKFYESRAFEEKVQKARQFAEAWKKE
jgi:hypothetical protein